MIKEVICILVALNVVTFVAYGIDKWKAKHGKWRISEATLLLLAVLGGSIGALAAMFLFHHKTLHAKFRYGVPAILLLQGVALVLCGCSCEGSPKPVEVKEEPLEYIVDSVEYIDTDTLHPSQTIDSVPPARRDYSRAPEMTEEEDGYAEGQALAEEDRLTGKPYSQYEENTDDEDYDEGFEDGYEDE